MSISPPEFKVLVIDDQYGRPGIDRDAFLSLVQADESEFVFATGQTEDGSNVSNLTLETVERLWDRQGDARLSLVLLDVRFADARDPHADRFGIILLRALRERFGRTLPIVMLTTESEVRATANEASADGFLPKEQLTKERFDDQYFRNALFPDATGRLIGTSLPFLLALRELRRVARSGVREILLLGETGTGKSDLARYVHAISGRAGQPFTTWFARATNADLHYDTLFGHWRGAFFGANDHQAGEAEKANRGVLFIDEIADLNPAVQTDLLEYRYRSDRDNLRRIRRLGHYPAGAQGNLNLFGQYSAVENRILVDTLLVTATNRPIDDAAWRERAQFRLDIFNRLGHRVAAPPLRERVEDIATLFLLLFRRAANRDVALSPAARQSLEAHEWREGNVQEVKTAAEAVSARIGAEFDEIHAHHLEGLLGATPRHEKVGSASLVETGDRPTVAGGSREAPLSQRGALTRLVDFEVDSLWGIAERLRTAVIETRRPGRPGTLADIFRHATGVEYAATDVKREVKDILAPWFAPSDRQAARWKANPQYQQLAGRVRNDIILSSLYNYAAGETNWDLAKDNISASLAADLRTS